MNLGHAWDEGRQAWNRLCGHSADPGDGDRALIALSDIGTVRRALEHAELQAVRIARRHRKSWSEIAVQLGVTRQSAWERWRDVNDQSPRGGTEVKSGSGVRFWLDRGGGAGVRESHRPRPTPAREMLPEPTDEAVG
jgi:hypothetical protein